MRVGSFNGKTFVSSNFEYAMEAVQMHAESLPPDFQRGYIIRPPLHLRQIIQDTLSGIVTSWQSRVGEAESYYLIGTIEEWEDLYEETKLGIFLFAKSTHLGRLGNTVAVAFPDSSSPSMSFKFWTQLQCALSFRDLCKMELKLQLLFIALRQERKRIYLGTIISY